MSDTEVQQQLVFWSYVIQWLGIFMPFAWVVSLIYLLSVRSRVLEPSLRSHLDWMLTTCLVIAGSVAVGAVLFFVGMRGINTDAPISIAATFMLLALSAVLPIWLLYRLVRGTLQYRNRLPMETLFP